MTLIGAGPLWTRAILFALASPFRKNLFIRANCEISPKVSHSAQTWHKRP
jgi:hypothetical protein